MASFEEDNPEIFDYFSGSVIWPHNKGGLW